MSLSSEQIKSVEATIKESLRRKFQDYKPESKNMPFHYRLLGKDRMALYSFIHSLNTAFGTSIYEPVAEALAATRFLKAQSQYVVGSKISEIADNEISRIIANLTIGNMPDKHEEIEKIRDVSQRGKMITLKPGKVDLFVQNYEDSIFLFDLKTAKPNMENFKSFKRKLLEWCAIIFAKNPGLDVHSLIAIPYNPYEPAPYERWTLQGMLDLEKELKVADEFWDFLGGDGAYQDLLDCFESAGIALRPEIDQYFANFKS
ncbi:MAG: TdeIII family type II restriction endonuclease [Candidatus Poribacteria bacterium]|nr:TdeIII family type II restriction endonuclease [Candidatus Poribacteria bacterium]